MLLNLEIIYFSFILINRKDFFFKKEYMVCNYRWFVVKSKVDLVICDFYFDGFLEVYYVGIYIRLFFCWIIGKRVYRILKRYYKYVIVFFVIRVGILKLEKKNDE